MNTHKHLQKLVAALGNYTNVARHIGLHPRPFRQCRSGHMSKNASNLLKFASHSLYLRLLLKELRRSGVVSDQAVLSAAKAVQQELKS